MKLRNKKTGELENFEIKQRDNEFPLEENTICFINGKPISLKVLNEYYEDAKEPLIKDEGIRKAVRAWAEANDIDDIVCYAIENGFVFAGNVTRLDIGFNKKLGINTDRRYTLAELCGEEGE